MRNRRPLTVFCACSIALGACSVTVESGENASGAVAAVPADEAVVAEPTGQPDGATAAVAPPSTTVEPTVSTTTDAPAASSTVADTTTTTTTEPEPDVFDPACVVEIEPLDSLALIAAEIDDDTVNVITLRAENNLPNADLQTGEFLDVCVDNGLDDVTGAQRTGPDDEIVAFAVKQNVELQQLKLNRLFEGLGTPPLLVDGISGPVTRQRLCAARLALGIPTSTLDMEAGSEEEDILFAADELPIPFTSSILSERWILIDRTCQIMFIGESHVGLTFVFPTSTGSAGHRTRDQDRSAAFRFDPALGNGGWHDSTDFPSAADNPLNGNMYKPLYFDLGQAIHGANNVPTSPQSKGCARLRVEHQNQLVDWLGLDGAPGPIWSPNQIDITVNVQGAYVAR